MVAPFSSGEVSAEPRIDHKRVILSVSEESRPFQEACYKGEDSILQRVYLEWAIEMLRGVYPEREIEILHFVQDDERRIRRDNGAGQPVEVSLVRV